LRRLPDFTLADLLAAQAGAPGPVYEGGPDANVRPGELLTALARLPVGGIEALSKYLGIPAGEQRNAAGEVVFPTNAFERGLQSTDTAAGQYAAAVMGPGGGPKTIKSVGPAGVGSGVRAAVKVGDQTFTGTNHVLAMDAAEKALGRSAVQDAMIAESQALTKRFEAGENIAGGGNFNGFVTPDGRYLSRQEANQFIQNPRGFARAEDLPASAEH
jgi:hypothetical protein